MKLKCSLLVIVLVVTLFLSIQVRFPKVSSTGEVIRVPADYSTIQDAVNVAAPESVILVSSGVYQENLVINKTVSLIGEDKTTTVIDGGGEGTVVEINADRVTLDGFTIQNSALMFGAGGVFLNSSRYCRIGNNIITHNVPSGIEILNSKDNIIERNIVTFSGIILPGWISGWNIGLWNSYNNTIIGNTLSDAVVLSLSLTNANETTILFNTIESNSVGLDLFNSYNNTVHHNIFVNNMYHLMVEDPNGDTWNYNNEGNYWDDYIGLDDGYNGRVAGDGVGDTDLPHAGVDHAGIFVGVDNYPLVHPPFPIPIVIENTLYPVAIESNSTVSMFRFVQAEKKITFNMTGPASTTGYCNITVPKTLLRDSPWTILANGTDITSESTITENETHSFLYFTYDHSGINNIQIIGTWAVPEFPPKIISTLMLLLSTVIIVLRKHRKDSNRLSTSKV